MITTTPPWAVTSKLSFVHAPADLKGYAKEIHHMAPRWYATRGNGDDREFYIWNTRRSEHVLDAELALFWQYR